MAGQQRFVISVRIIGAVHRDAPRLKIFMMSVLWTDESEVIIYRSFKEFKKFHRQLKKRFPLLNPLGKSNRVIPKFNGKARRSSLKQKGTQRSVKRMKFLESYCTELLKCEQTVTRSSEVTQFFTPKAHDLDQDFTKNSFMILLSDDQPDGSGGGGWGVTHQQAGSITHPFVTVTYRCVAAYETKDTKNHPFKVDVDEKVDVLIKDPTGWWLIENESRRLAWFPAPYLEPVDEEEDDDDKEEFPGRGNLYCAVKTYSTKKSDEVSVPIGSVVEVLRKSDNGWWLVRFNGKAGYIPSMYLQQYNNPRMGIFSMQRKLHSSSLNLGTSPVPETPQPPSTSEATGPQSVSDVQFRTETSLPQRLLRAQSLNVLSETWLATQVVRNDVASGARARSMSNTSAESSNSDFSSSGESYSSLKEVQPQSTAAETRGSSDGSCSSFTYAFSDKGSDISSTPSDSVKVAPRVPPRPKTQEILTRCTSMTRKAALATKTRVQNHAELIQTR